MPNMRDTSATNYMSSPADRLTTFASIATHGLTATYVLWLELLENQKQFTVRLLDAMRASTNKKMMESSSPSPADAPRRRRSSSKATPSVGEFPIKRYDSLNVREIVGKLDQLRDRRSLRTVLAYEAKNKARKGVAAAGEARLKHLSYS